MNVFKSATIFENNKDEYVNKTYNQFKSYNTLPKNVAKKDFKIKENEFPELSTPIKNNSSNTKTFTFLLKEEEPIKVEVKTEDIVPPGWTLYKYAKKNNDLFGKSSKLISKIENPIIDKNQEIVKLKVMLNESDEIINALTRLHEKRTNKYKELWGEDEWEQMFNCPNYDYEYFDRLDEEYEVEQNKINEEQYNNYEEHDDY